MNNKKILLVVFSVLFLVSFLSMMVSATGEGLITNTTINGTNISGTYSIYVNATGCAASCYLGNVTFNWTYYNGTSYTIATVANDTGNDTVFFYSWVTTAATFPDSQNGSLNFTSRPYTGETLINASNLTRDINLDNNAPTVAVYGTAPTAYANTTIRTTTAVATANLTLSIYVTDAAIGMANASRTSVCFVSVGTGINHTIPMFNVGRSNGWCNLSDTNASTALNISGLSDGNSTINIYVNDTIAANANRLNGTLVAHIDTTAPTSSATCSPTTVQTGATYPCSCSGTDATSGVSTSTGSSTSNSITSTASTGTFTYTCSVADNGGLTASSTATYTVTQTPGNPATPATPAIPSRVYSFTKITPGSAVIMKDFNAETGLKQIEIEVNNEAQNVKISVTKYDGKPAEVSVSKTGKVYQYIQIDAQNLGDKLEMATVQFKVEKSWASSNGLDKDEIAVSKFDESSGRWNQLQTNYNSEDNNYYYYDVELDSFSYFAIAERSVTDADAGTAGDGVTEEKGGSLLWLWILIAVVILALVWYSMKRKR